jgi:hypothetical protein
MIQTVVWSRHGVTAIAVIATIIVMVLRSGCEDVFLKVQQFFP